MPLNLEIKKKLSARSDRVKSVDFHPSEPWVLSALYSGNLMIWDHNTQTLVKQVEVCQLPVRCAKFVTRKQWIVTASDDMNVRVWNYNSLEKVHEFEAHTDYIRYIAVHPTNPYIITASDDMTIKLWDWDKSWSPTVFEGHAHYVMMCQWNPKDVNTFASCSLDRTIKAWTVGCSTCNYTLSGHDRGVNCVDYKGVEKPYLISGADDKTVRIWDYQTKGVIAVLSGHTTNVSMALAHPSLPIILSGSEDGTVRVWHEATYRQEMNLNYLLERVWSIACLKGTNLAAIGYDEGTVVIRLGGEEPLASLHASSGKVVWVSGHDIQSASLKGLAEDTNDGERLVLSIRDMGAAEFFPQSIAHHPNGRTLAVCGDGEYVVYTSQVLRNKAFGQAMEFVWGFNGAYATRDASGKITVYQDFKEAFAFKPPFTVEEIFGGRLIGVREANFVCFYDWSQYVLVRRIDAAVRRVIWSEDGTNVVLVCTDSFYILKHDIEALAKHAGADVDDDGIESAFEVVTEVQEKVTSGCWIGDCFVFIKGNNALLSYIAGVTEVLAHLDRPQFLLGYIPETSKIYLIDKELSITPYTLHLALIEYQSAVIKGNFEAAQPYFDQLPESLHNRIARFLESQNHLQQALQVSKDPDHRFDLAMQLGKLAFAEGILSTPAATGSLTTKSKWKALGDVALEQGNFELAERAFKNANDMTTLFLMQTSAGDWQGLQQTAQTSKSTGIGSLAFLSFLLLGNLEEALSVLIQCDRLPEAAFFARTYLPSKLAEVVNLWKADLKTVNESVANALASPSQHADLFPDYPMTLQAEAAFQAKRSHPLPPSAFESEKAFLDMDVLAEVQRLSPAGFRSMLLKNLQGAKAADTAPEKTVEAASPPPAAPVEPDLLGMEPETTTAAAATLAGPETTPDGELAGDLLA